MSKKNDTFGEMETVGANNGHPRTYLLLLYFGCYILCGTYIQVHSDKPPWFDGSPLESFTGTLLWLSSFTSLLIADALRSNRWKSWLWLVISAGLAFVALDEIFVFHEQTLYYVGDDDHVKVLQWLVAGGGVYFIHRVGVSSFKARISFVTGYILHTFYVTSDVGDGDYFRIPFASITQLAWAEEYFELFSLTAYFLGFLFLYAATRVATFTRDQHISRSLS
jgi:hypothetical protein